MTCERDCIEEQGNKFTDGAVMGFIAGILVSAVVCAFVAVSAG